jgi:hypothetical protein
MPYKRKMLSIGDSFIYKGKRIALKETAHPRCSNSLQANMDVYTPIEAYSEKWKTVTKQNGYWEDYVSSHPIPNTRKRNDLPSLASQWRDSYQKSV